MFSVKGKNISQANTCRTVKVNLLLLLTKIPRHWNVYGVQMIQRILNFGNRWKWMVGFTLRPLYVLRKNSNWTENLEGLRVDLTRWRWEIFVPLPGIKRIQGSFVNVAAFKYGQPTEIAWPCCKKLRAIITVQRKSMHQVPNRTLKQRALVRRSTDQSWLWQWHQTRSLL
jgi:hypothetical protein